MELVYTLIIVAAIFALAIVLIIQHFLKKQTITESFHYQSKARQEQQAFNLPHRMEAYQRAILLLERIHPASLVLRLNQPNISAQFFQAQLLKTIREEYDHNVAQQLFISPKAWSLLKNAKEETVKLINVAASQLPADANSGALSTLIITLTAEVNPLPSEIAIEALKNEFQQFS